MTLEQFAQELMNILCPTQDSPFYKKNGQARLNAFFTFHKEHREWLEECHPDVAKIVRTALKHYDYFWADCNILRNIGNDIGMKIQAYLPKETPKQQTNGDWIRSMSDGDLFKFLDDLLYNCMTGHCDKCPVSGYKPVDGDCDMKLWIKKHHKED